jgi:hydroxypyruvate reductase
MPGVVERDLRGLLHRAFDAAVDAARPERVLDGHLPQLTSGRLIVIGAGKAAASMARAVERHYAAAAPGLALTGLVITRYGHAVATDRIAVREAGHPVPDAAGAAATGELLATLADAEEGDAVLCLISGGGSALLCAPRGLDLDGKRALTEALLRSGATIDEMNAVRKHLSGVKGGQLARAAQPARLTTLVISDVVGDDPSVIASGPTVPDPSSYRDALEVLDRYKLEAFEARAFLQRGSEGAFAETPKPGDPLFERCRAITVASNQQSLEAAAATLRSAGLPAHILSATIEGEAREAGRLHAAIARQIVERGQPFAAPCALLSGGETTVTVRGPGRGGRNQEFALALALALPPDLRIYALAADTDGIDGSEHNAGAFVTPTLLRSGRDVAAAALDRNDSHAVFADADHLLVTGPTHTNVNDLRIVVVLPR